MVTFVWLVVAMTMKEELKYVYLVNGEQSVMTDGMQPVQRLLVIH